MSEHQKTEDFPFNSPEQLARYLPYLITRLSNRWRTGQDAELKTLGIQGASMRIMSCLAAYNQLTVNEVSVLSVTEQSTVSRLVEQLVSQGLARRKIDEIDQRVRRVSLTAKGRKKLAETAPIVNAGYQNMIEGIDPDDLAVCIDALQAMLKKVRVHDL
ncbi:DNA-binding transcriptional regulator, MarR family [Celeribacter baekdonensis]|jgi:MarR family transcriptional regulator for hemolysin|uniref:DNA-binding transcriptional regulator, MarR family n=1 Tax=Celeribacter baekdonensis TaxID=875171 RepID=A0A1G7SID8_9RHOB|nr:MarR family winged helix-turn-helix transcriptional regulator [Celeribacter baekdonensis]SDG22654.1 DNA-binding transcriptional regulator, MarR family [Celeribacter baekdonensis]